MSEHEAINGGIYDAFPGYRLPSDDEIDAALQSALVVVDANVLLNLYRYNESTRDDLLGILSRLGNRLWTPHQVMREFWRNRLSVLASRDTAASQALDALAKQHRAIEAALLQWRKPLPSTSLPMMRCWKKWVNSTTTSKPRSSHTLPHRWT